MEVYKAIRLTHTRKTHNTLCVCHFPLPYPLNISSSNSKTLLNTASPSSHFLETCLILFLLSGLSSSTWCSYQTTLKNSLETLMASIIGVSSIYQTPSLEPYRRVAASSSTAASAASSSLPFPEKSHFNSVLRAYNSRLGGGGGGGGLVASAIATPNSVLSEEAFKGLGDFSQDSLDDDFSDEKDYESDEGELDSASVDDDELAISKLGLPQRLVDSLEKRGITHLFPIQVLFFSLSGFCIFFGCFRICYPLF